MLGFTMQSHDLRAIGELILQLVEGRLLQSSYDYNFPIARTSAWDKFGKEGEFWRGVCNRLLDPRLSPDKENLEKLEREFRPSAVAAKMPLILTVTAVVCVLVAVVVGTRALINQTHRAHLDKALAEADDFLRDSKFFEALKASDEAVKVALSLKDADAGDKAAAK